MVTPKPTFARKTLARRDIRRWVAQTSRETRVHVAAVAVIVAFTAMFFAPLLQGRTFSMVGAHMFAQYPWLGVIKGSPEVSAGPYGQTDHAETFYPASVFATNALRGGEFPMWLPYSFSGVPIMEVGIGAGLLYPPKLLAMTLLSPIHQQDILLFIHLLLAGLGMYALLRCWDANALGAVLGAVIWELNGHNAFWLIFEHVAITAAWLPLMLLGATLAVRKQSFNWAVGAGAALGMSILNGDMVYVELSALVLACWYAALAGTAARRLSLSGRQRDAVVCLSLPIVSVAVAAALSAASWLSLLGLLSHVNRRPNTLEEQLLTPIPWRSFLRALFLPNRVRLLSDFASFAFVGTPAQLLVVAGFVRRSAPVLLAGLIGSISVGMALGFRPLVIILRLVVPYFGAMHLHVALFLFCFAAAALAAFGVTEASRYFRRFQPARRLLLGIGLCLIAIVSLQLILFARVTTPIQPERSEWLYPETPVISSLKAAQGEFHVLPIRLRLPSGEVTPPVMFGKVPAIFGLRSGSGYESLLPVWTENLWMTVEQGGVPATGGFGIFRTDFYQDRLPVNLLEKLSVGFLVTPPDTKPRDVNGSDPVADGSLQLVYQGADGWIYKLTHALPRAFLVPRVITVTDSQASLRMLVDEKFNARETAIVTGDNTPAKIGLPSDDSSRYKLEATARIITDRLNEVEVEVETPHAAMMVLNDSWDAGWNARVDGVPQPVLKVNYNSRGVVVPPGKHDVLFLYRPRALLIGLGISGVTMLLLFVAGVWVGCGSLRRLRKKDD